MKKILMALNCGRAAFAAVLCCAMTMAVLTACSDKDDDPVIPSEDVNKGIFINLGSIVIKPYMQFGTSLADVEAYMQKNYGDWTYTKDDQQEGQIFSIKYSKDNKIIVYAFSNTPIGSLRLATYGFENTEISFPEIKAELERNGFIYQGRLNFEFPVAADEYQLFLSADSSIEVQFARWEEGDRWAIGFQPLDEDDLNYLESANK